MSTEESRRKFLTAAAAVGAGVVLRGEAHAAEGKGAKKGEAKKEKPADVNATEDMMREHGVLRRILLVYGEGVRRIEANNSPPAEIFASSANIIRRFIEGYHEKLEEQFVFPKMQQVGQQTELVQVLLAQHEAGRKVTARILAAATPAGFANAATRQQLAADVRAFIRMYEPHAAREDTVLFPAYHELFSEKEFDELGDKFEEQEHKLLGSGGFEGAVKEVADLEKAIGIGDLAAFTPR